MVPRSPLPGDGARQAVCLWPRARLLQATLAVLGRSCFVPAREEEEPCLCHRLLHETTSFCLAEQYKLLSDHIEQMAVE